MSQTHYPHPVTRRLLGADTNELQRLEAWLSHELWAAAGWDEQLSIVCTPPEHPTLGWPRCVVRGSAAWTATTTTGPGGTDGTEWNGVERDSRQARHAGPRGRLRLIDNVLFHDRWGVRQGRT